MLPLIHARGHSASFLQSKSTLSALWLILRIREDNPKKSLLQGLAHNSNFSPFPHPMFFK